MDYKLIILLISIPLLFLINPAYAVTTTGNSTFTIIDSTSQPQDLHFLSNVELTQDTPYSIMADSNTILQPDIWIHQGDSFNFTIKAGNNTYIGYVNFVDHGNTGGIGSATLYISINGETEAHEQGYVNWLNGGNQRRISFGYAIGFADGQHYIIAVDDSNYGVGASINDLHDSGITSFVTTNTVGDLKYQITTYSTSEYNQAIDDGSQVANSSNNLLDMIRNSVDLIITLFNTFITILSILKVIFIDNLTLVIALTEGGILILAMRQNPRDIFGFVNDTVQYNIRFISFMVNLISGLIKVFFFVAQIGFNILKNIPIIGSFL